MSREFFPSGSHIKKWFLPVMESPAPAVQLRCSRLLKSSLDEPIMGELGDSKETTLGHVLYLVRRQKKDDKPGALLMSGRTNIFYVKDATGAPRAVSVHWYAIDGGWGVNANSVECPFRWYFSSRVFSHNS